MEEGLISPKAILKEEIPGCDITNWIAKILVFLELVNFFIPVIARAVEQLPVSPLELSTSAFAICAIITYAILYHKPQDATTVVPLGICPKVPQRIKELKMFVLSDTEDRLREYPGGLPAPLDVPGAKGKFGLASLFAFVFGAMVFSAIHVAGWDLKFPSVVDAWLWRSAALATIVPVMIFFAVPLSKRVRQVEGQTEGKFGILAIVHPMCSTVYVLARLILIVEMIRTLFYLPPAAYQTPSWPAGIPHIS